MGYISQPDLVQNMTPEQRILVSQFYTKFDIGSGVAHKKILNVEPLLYMGVIAGSEFLTYALTKMYLCLSLCFSHPEPETTDDPTVNLYDETNTLFFVLEHNSIAYTGAVLVDHGQTFEFTNCYFSYLTVSATVPYKAMKFIGYSITLT